MSRLSTKLAVAMVLMVVATTAFIEVVTFHGIENAILPRAREGIDAQVRLLAAELDNHVGRARADVRSFLAAAALDGVVRAHVNGGVHPIDGTSETVWRERMASRFVAELNAKPLYLQFRIIGMDDGGRELVRVDHSGPGQEVRSVTDAELQFKGDADYMAATMALPPGEIYVSDINLNREFGSVKQPEMPVMRVAAPIFAEDGTPFGILVVNMDMRRIFARVRGSKTLGEGIYMVNEQGDYLLHPNRAHEFGFEYGKPYRIQSEFPKMGSLLKTDGSWEETFIGPQGNTLIAAAVRIKFGSDVGVAIVKIVPYSEIIAPVWAIGYPALLAGLIVVLCAIVLAILIARSLTRPLRQMADAVEAFAQNRPTMAPISAGGEIGQLARTFERMASEVLEKNRLLKRETEEKLRIFETSLDLIIVVDRHGNLIRVSPSSVQSLGYRPDEMIGRNASDFVYSEDIEQTRLEMRRVRRGRTMRNYEVRHVHKENRLVTLAWAGVWSEPERQYFFIGRDVTEQRVAEELFRLAVEASPSGMLMVDHDGKIVMVNNELEQLFGYDREELIGKPVEMLVPGNFRVKHKKLCSDYLSKPVSRGMGTDRELYGLRKDGSEFPLEIGLNPITIRGGFLVLGVVVDTTERRQTERLKDEFVSTVSHELRTPLTSITASLALLTAGGAGALPTPASRLISIAHSNGQRLVRLVNDILDIEKIESGKMEFNLKRVNACVVVEQVLESSRAYANEAGVKLRLSAESIPGNIRADADRFAQVVTNLVSNAIKFSPRGEEVVVAVVEQENSVHISVRDHGAGIPEEFRPRIFDKFAQADGSDTRKKGGTGLGLSIVKQIVNRLGGEVSFESGLAKGTVFFVDLPRWRPEVDDQGDDAEHRNLVLMCEDDAEVAALLSAKMRKAGFIVNVAATVGEALQLADLVTYAAVLVDFKLPDGDGIGLIQGLRSRPRYHTIPIVVISGDPARGLADARSSALDILDWLDKPVNIDRLLQTLDRSIEYNRNGCPRILHVDEDATVRATVAEAMRRLAQVVSVGTLDEARAAAAKKPFDMAVLDVALIAGAGPEILTELHNSDGYSIPVVLLSTQGANPDYADRVSAALANSSNSIDNLVEVLTRRLGVHALPEPAGPGADKAQEQNRQKTTDIDQEVA